MRNDGLPAILQRLRFFQLDEADVAHEITVIEGVKSTPRKRV